MFTISRDEVSRVRSTDLGYVVQLERHVARVSGREDPATVALRVTMIFRPEDDGWRIVHRYADSLTPLAVGHT
jgi:ketosteroid isomerase-like protein